MLYTFANGCIINEANTFYQLYTDNSKNLLYNYYANKLNRLPFKYCGQFCIVYYKNEKYIKII
jgi:hypothetical protein